MPKSFTNNIKGIVRALEVYKTTGTTMTEQAESFPSRLRPMTFAFIGLDAENRQFLYDRIDRRVDIMFERGLENEAREYLASANGSTSAQAIGYKELRPYIDGEISLEEAGGKPEKSDQKICKASVDMVQTQ